MTLIDSGHYMERISVKKTARDNVGLQIKQAFHSSPLKLTDNNGGKKDLKSLESDRDSRDGDVTQQSYSICLLSLMIWESFPTGHFPQTILTWKTNNSIAVTPSFSL